MIELVENLKGNSFELRWNGRTIANHSPRSPMIEIGSGTGSYKVGGGVYRIRDTRRTIQKATRYSADRMQDSVLIRFPGAATMKITEKSGRLILSFHKYSNNANRLILRLASNRTERIYGCGEQYSVLNLKGRSVPIWIQEQGIGRGHDLLTFLANVTADGAGGSWHTTYYSQPSFVASSGLWLHSESTAYSIFDFTAARTTRLEFWQIPNAIHIGAEESLSDAVSALGGCVGRQPPLPEWVHSGVVLGAQGGTEAVLKKLEDANKAGVPVAAVWAQDWEGRRITSFGKQLWWNWKADDKLYPALSETIRKLRESGVRFLGYINPFLATERELYREASEKGYLVRNEGGSEAMITVTTFPAALVDLANPEAFEWIKSVIKEYMIGAGLSGWMADFGEWLPPGAVSASGKASELLHNEYPVLWARANAEAIREAGLENEIFFFCRSGYSGSAKSVPAFWAGDQMVDFSKTDGLPTVVTSALSLGFSGVGISHSDIGGYTSVGYIKRTKEVFMRWAEQAAFTPVMRTHESNRPDTNWQFNSDGETLAHFARMAKIYAALAPYRKAVLTEYIREGKPPVRHLSLAYPEDQTAASIDDQYLFGSCILAAPVLKKGRKTRKVYIPEDGWIGLFDGKARSKGWRTEPAPFGYPPVLVRKDSAWETLFETIRKEFE
ncbi:MAG: Alpha-xylosidase [Spirochaetes bacterium ADurb.Bin269]|nr:MAG: Alpha-xylosidase [Spirochaetes bacterium ADurb.Bin269]HPX47056.1 alpha-glucosidase [Treponemataceae bacterium]